MSQERRECLEGEKRKRGKFPQTGKQIQVGGSQRSKMLDMLCRGSAVMGV